MYLLASETPLVFTGVIALCTILVTPLLLSWLNGRQIRAAAKQNAEIRAHEKQEDYDRQDEVAKVAAEQQAEVARVAAEQQQAVADQVAQAAMLLEERQKGVAQEVKRSQDEVAAQAREAAALLAANQLELLAKTNQVAQVAKDAQESTDKRLGELRVVADQTHLLVNSNMMKQIRKGLVTSYALVENLKSMLIILEHLPDPTDAEKLQIVAIETQATAVEREIRSDEDALHDLEDRTDEAHSVAKHEGPNAPKEVA